MFTVLLRLRQVCNDLRLLGAPTLLSAQSNLDADESVGAPSEETGGKWPALADIVDDALGGSHKILIFSQFTGMLRLLRDWLDARSIGHSYLDGSTRDRGAQVAAFQTDPVRRVFLISLKAGGYGLNLTAADHVILVEPWWNPAVEAQAIDRAHRIGQASPVTASRLIARGTVEERILKLQATKRQFMASAVEDDPLTLPGLNDDDLESLLE
ncbi:MAG: SWF/SNF helicase family protein [Verrucomicrobia bacterium]|nr:SWF/SNF helicase family protein [Verrucomicrobiota bacterium]